MPRGKGKNVSPLYRRELMSMSNRDSIEHAKTEGTTQHLSCTQFMKTGIINWRQDLEPNPREVELAAKRRAEFEAPTDIQGRPRQAAGQESPGNDNRQSCRLFLECSGWGQTKGT